MQAAGIHCEFEAPDVDERAVEEPDPARLAVTLARAKAAAVAARRPGAVVIGSDQVFTLNGRYLSKPATIVEAREKLGLMNGRTHRFHCGLALVRDGDVLYETVATADVTFHELSEVELDAYADTGEGVGCAGAYRLEEGGVRLVKELRGDHFTVLGLPMLPLVQCLRDLGLAESAYRSPES